MRKPRNRVVRYVFANLTWFSCSLPFCLQCCLSSLGSTRPPQRSGLLYMLNLNSQRLPRLNTLGGGSFASVGLCGVVSPNLCCWNSLLGGSCQNHKIFNITLLAYRCITLSLKYTLTTSSSSKLQSFWLCYFILRYLGGLVMRTSCLVPNLPYTITL